MILIPVDPTKSADQSFRVQLGNQITEIRLTWNSRSERWAMTISGAFGTLSGLHLVPDWPILRDREAATSFEGDFIVRALTAAVGDRIGYEELGTVWGLCWMTPDEKAAWEVYYGLE